MYRYGGYQNLLNLYESSAFESMTSSLLRQKNKIKLELIEKQNINLGFSVQFLGNI